MRESLVDDVIKKFKRELGWTRERILKETSRKRLRLASKHWLRNVIFKPDVNLRFQGYKISGYLLQSRGIINTTPCSWCRNGNGPFIGNLCISLTDKMVVSQGACAACVWSNRVRKCEAKQKYLKFMNKSKDDTIQHQPEDSVSKSSERAHWTRLRPCLVETDRLKDLTSVRQEFLACVRALQDDIKTEEP